MGEAQLNTSMHVLGEAMTMAKLASASRVPWLRRTTSKQLHTKAWAIMASGGFAEVGHGKATPYYRYAPGA